MKILIQHYHINYWMSCFMNIKLLEMGALLVYTCFVTIVK